MDLGVRFWSNKYICIRPSTSQPSCSCTHVLSGGSWTMCIYIYIYISLSLSLCKKGIIVAWVLWYVGGVCIMVITHHFFGWKFGKDLFLLVLKFWKVKRMAWFATKKKMSLVQSCLISVGVQLVSTLGGEGGGACNVHSPLLSLFLIFSPWPGVGLSCTFTYPKWHNLGLNAIYALGINTWSIHF